MPLNNVDLYRIDGTIGSVSNIQTAAINNGSIAGNRNRVINGDMRIWQRGTTFTSVGTSTYTADRFSTTSVGVNFTVTRDTDVPNAQFKYSLKAVPASSTTPTEAAMRQQIEQLNMYDFAGQSVTTSAWVKCSKSQVKLRLGSLNNTGGTDITQTVNVTAGTWTKISYTHTNFLTTTAWTATPTDAGGYVDIGFVDSTLVSTSDYIFVTGVQVEPGTIATPFERRSYGQELELCQRYYEHSSGSAESNWKTLTWEYADGVISRARANQTTDFYARYRVEKRVAPTHTWYSATGVAGNVAWENPGVTNLTNLTGLSGTTVTRVLARTRSSSVPDGAFLYANWEATAEL